MAALLPVVCFGFIGLLVHRELQRREPGTDWRHAFLLAATAWGVLVAVITEALSAFRALTVAGVLGLWGICGLACAALWLRRRAVLALPGRSSDQKITRGQVALVCGLVLLAGLTGLTGLAAPPNAWDALTYHMSRVVAWIQNRSVAYYPTHIVRQLYPGPWAEYAILQLQLLSGSDRLANLVQWFSMIGSSVGVSLIARQLGANAQSQTIAAVVSMTIPVGILEASSAKNDYVVSFWLVCLVSFFLWMKAAPRPLAWWGGGGALGLALFTKATAYIFAFPILIWFGLWSARRLRTAAWQPLLLMGLLPICINAGLYIRNMDLFGSLLGPAGEMPAGRYDPTFNPTFSPSGGGAGEVRYANDLLTLPAVVSNIVRNVGLHTVTPFPRINSALDQGIRTLHFWLGLDIDDPRTTWPGEQFHIPAELSYRENTSSNPLHLILSLAGLAYFGGRGGRRATRDCLIYSAALTAAFLGFCIYLKWQPWHSRLHLPLFVLWAPLIAVGLSRLLPARMASLLAFGLIVCAGPWVLFNETRPLARQANILNSNRIDQYFASRPGARERFLGAAQFIQSQHCSQVGLLFGWWNELEYPLWVLLQAEPGASVRLEHVNVQNASARLSDQPPFRAFEPCAVIATDYSGESPATIRVGHSDYGWGWSSAYLQVYVKDWIPASVR